MNLDCVIVIVKCCIPETNETNFEKNICNDIEKIVTIGTGGQQATFLTFFDPKTFVIVLIFKISFHNSEAYLHALENTKRTDFAQQRFSQRAKTAG